MNNNLHYTPEPVGAFHCNVPASIADYNIRWVVVPLDTYEPKPTADLYQGRSAIIRLRQGRNEVRMQYTNNGYHSISAVKIVEGGYDQPPILYTVSPNPASTTLYFELVENETTTYSTSKQSGMQVRNQQSATCEVRLTNVATGVQVLNQTVANFDSNFDLNISALSQGLYLLTLLRNGEVVPSQNTLIQ